MCLPGRWNLSPPGARQALYNNAMRILLIADGRSPTTRRWIQAVRALEHDVVLVSTFPCQPVVGVEAEVLLPVAFAGAAGSASGSAAVQKRGWLRRVVSGARPLLLPIRHMLGPLTLHYYGRRLRWLVERIQPDLVHALRLPFEGMLAAYTPQPYPVAVSLWGNDLTFHAAGSASMARLTRTALARASALLADTRRDVRLARAWGFDVDKPALVVPGAGGLNLEELAQVKQNLSPGGGPLAGKIPPGAVVIVNPRGFRTGSVRNDTFFEAIPLVLERRAAAPVVFACAAMAGQPEAQRWIDQLKLHGKVVLLPHLPQQQLWQVFAQAQLTISVSQHDGTPNSLLEAMALGVFPIAGDIESLREWITPGVNGLLVEPNSPQQLAEAILLALDHAHLRRDSAVRNAMLVQERAGAEMVRGQIDLLYRALAAGKETPTNRQNPTFGT